MSTFPSSAALTVQQIEEEARAAERQRTRDIEALRGRGTPESLIQQCIRDGLTVDQASRAILEYERASRSAPVGETGRGGTGAPAGIVRDPDSQRTVDVLSAYLSMRVSNDPRDVPVPRGLGLVGDARRDYQARLANMASDYCSGMTMLDICRESLRLDGERMPYSRSEMFRMLQASTRRDELGLTERGMTGSASNIFSTSFNSALMREFIEFADTTREWCEEEDVPNFQTRELVDVTASHQLEKLGRGGTAKEATISDDKESYRVARYARKATIDEQDVIDERFEVFTRIPREMGRAAARLRPDLVYAILLANAALDRDSIALFHASSHGGNLLTDALSISALSTAIAVLSKQVINGVNLNLMPTHLIVPQDLRHTAGEITQSESIVIAGNTDTVRGNLNVIRGEDITPVADNRIGTAGVIDPDTGIAYAGTATNWFLVAARQGPVVIVGYLAGTGRRPQVRRFVLDKGQWGIGWDVAFDIGAKAEHYATMVKSTGAG